MTNWMGIRFRGGQYRDRSGHIAAGIICGLAVVSAPASSCRTAEPPTPGNGGNGDDSGASSAAAVRPDAAPVRIHLGSEGDDPNRWLHVEKVRGDAPGGWATGWFDAKRNRLDIQTEDVEQFAIDVNRIAIDWQRLVVIRINGASSELRRRDYSRFHFSLDKHRRWIVIEP